MIFRKWWGGGCLKLFQKFIRFGDDTHPLPSNQQISQTLAEFTESIDVVGARKNRIESAANISDVLEVFSQNICSRLWSRIVFLGDISLLMQKIATFTSVWYIFSFLLEQNITGWYFQCLGTSEKTQGAHCRNKHWGMFEQKISAWQQDVMNLVGMFPKLSCQLPRNI